MREQSVARNYAEVLVTLATQAKDLEGWGTKMSDIAEVCASDKRLREFLSSPRVMAAEKSRIVGQAFQKQLPPKLVRFLQAVISHRRQHLLGDIAVEYMALVDTITGHAHAQVQVVREPDEQMKAAVIKELSRITGLTVVPHFTVRPQILGGLVVRMGDTVMDGSLAKRLASLRTRMLGSAAR